MDRLLTSHYLERAAHWLAHVDTTAYTQKAKTYFEQLASQATAIIENIDGVKRRLQEKRYDLSHPPKRDWELLTAATQLVSAPFFPCEWNRNTYLLHGLPRKRPQSVEHLLNHITQPERDFFGWAYTRPEISQLILKDGMKMAGVSVAALTQLVPTFVLCNYLRKNLPGIHIILGGPLMRYLVEPFSRSPEIFDYVDSVLICRGEDILAEIFAHVDSESDWTSVPGLMYRRAGTVRLNRLPTIFDLSTYTAPDYEQMEVRSYLSDEFQVTYNSSSGCYWGKCAFCSETRSNNTYPYQSKPTDIVVREIENIVRSTSVNVIEMADNAMPLKKALTISRFIADRRLQVCWTMLARLEKQFEYERLRELAAGGLRFIAWGMETFARKTIGKINKGIAKESAIRILRDSHKAGIWNHLFILIGFPGEDTEDILETLDQLVTNIEFIDSLTLSNYHLQRHSHVYDNPARYGIAIRDGVALQIDPSYWYDPQPFGGASVDNTYSLTDLYLSNMRIHTSNFLGFSTSRISTLLNQHHKNILRERFASESNRRSIEIAELI